MDSEQVKSQLIDLLRQAAQVAHANTYGDQHKEGADRDPVTDSVVQCLNLVRMALENDKSEEAQRTLMLWHTGRGSRRHQSQEYATIFRKDVQDLIRTIRSDFNVPDSVKNVNETHIDDPNAREIMAFLLDLKEFLSEGISPLWETITDKIRRYNDKQRQRLERDADSPVPPNAPSPDEPPVA